MVRPSPGRWALVLSAVLVVLPAVPLSGSPGHSMSIPGGTPGGSPSPALAIPAAGPSPKPSAPHAVTNLTVLGTTPSAVALGWKPVSTVTFVNYTILESSNSSSGPFQVAGVITSSSTSSFSGSSLTPGAQYWWQVVANSLLGGAQSSNVISAIQPTLAYLNVTQPQTTTAFLSWSNNASYGGPLRQVSYKIYETTGAGAPTMVGKVTDQAVLNFTVSGLVPSSSYSFYVNTTDCISTCGAGNGVQVVTGSNVVTFGTPRPLVASISANQAVVDAGQLDYLTCTPSGGRSPYTFTWDFGNGSYASGPSGQSHAWASASTPQVTCLITDAVTGQSSAAITISVNQALMVSTSANRTNADVLQPIAFACLTSGGSSPRTLSWDLGGGGISSSPTLSYGFSAPGMWVASCTATDFAGEQSVSSVSVDISPLPIPTVAASALAAAPGTALSFNLTIRNGSAPFTPVTWSFGDGQNATGNSSSHRFASAGNFTVRASAVDANGVLASDSAVVSVSPLTIALGAPTSTLLISDSYGLSAAIAGGAGGPYNVSWSFSDGSSAYGPSVAHRFTALGAIHARVVGTDRLGATVVGNLTLRVVAPTPTIAPAYLSWLLLLPAGLAGIVVAPVALRTYRRAEEKSLSGAAQYVLPTDPERTLTGVRKCRNCGTSNSAVRETCGTCGDSLPHSLFH